MSTLYRNPDNDGLLRIGSAIAKNVACCCRPTCWDCRRSWPDEVELVVSGWSGPESSAMNGTFVCAKQEDESDYRERCWYRVFLGPLWVGTGIGGYSPSSVNGYAVEMGESVGFGVSAIVWPMTAIASLSETDPTWGSVALSGHSGFASGSTKRCNGFGTIACSGAAWSITKIGTGTWATGPSSCTVNDI